ncbi:putative oxidoreductase GLYR1 isoform X2 [Haliotis rufescens]|uniref:putative oxidoreductase GLYR1 isoform X2 n=1 Tax=Haliotis rufescens TaxID=6454 RepID=UPI001EAF8F60|nr:putative oxidoreductase GLYR1 isoform X2 [Haliotis rufescens]
MAAKFKVGDLVWAKMKGFPAWPGRVIQPKDEVKRPSNKKPHHFVFFFGSENYAWIPEESIHLYADNRNKYSLTSRIPRGFKEAIEAIEDALKALPASVAVKTCELPSIDEELAQIFPTTGTKKDGAAHRDYSREPLAGKKSKKGVEERQSSAPVRSGRRSLDNRRRSGESAERRRSSSVINGTSKSRDSSVDSVVKKPAESTTKGKNKDSAKKPTPVRKPTLKRPLSASKDEPRPSTSKTPPTKRQKILVNTQTVKSPVKSPETPKSSESIVIPDYSKTPNISKDEFYQEIGLSPEPTKIKSKDVYDMPDDEEMDKVSWLSMTMSLQVKGRQGTSGKSQGYQHKDLGVPSTTTGTAVSSSTQIDDALLTRNSAKSVIPTPLRIGFLGLGIMGQGMVMNLLRSGHEVTVWNRTASKCREFVKAGALRGTSPNDVVQNCDITFTCVADSGAVRDIVFGNSGVLQGISRGKCYVEMSTVDEETVEDVAEAIMARGGVFLEAPVVGSRVPALEGRLVILTSGDRKLYDDCFSCFEAMGKKSFYLGNEVGTATRMKLIHNMLLGTVMAGLAEAMALAEKVGIDMEDLSEVLSLGSLSCPTINHKSQAMVNGKFDPHFPLQHQQKDLRLVLGLGDRVEQPLYVASAANEMFKKARSLGFSESDISAVVRAANA